VSAVTQAVYGKCVKEFEASMGTSVSSLDAGRADVLLDQYIVKLFKSGENIEAGRYALYAVAWARSFPTRSPDVLPLAKASLKGFEKQAPGGTNDPIPWEAVCLAARNRAETGVWKNLLFAAAALVSFDCYNRMGETLTLRTSHVIPPTRGPRGEWALIIRPSTERRTTKSGAQDDTIFVGSVDRRRLWLGSVLRSLLQVSRRGGLIFDLTIRDCELALREALEQCSLSQLKVTPHCLRHGGPSADMLEGLTSKLEVQGRGRWLCAQSVARYEKRGRLLRQLHKMTEDQIKQGALAGDWLKANLARLIRSTAPA